jgi:1-acyl-sn-glycerol-3-phosphate acyltransferase
VQCRDRLAKKVSVMIFPEGTRSRSWEMLPFKDGAFRLAIESGAPILPIAVAGTRDAMAKGTFRFLPARAIAQLLEPIPTTGMTLADFKEQSLPGSYSMWVTADHPLSLMPDGWF